MTTAISSTKNGASALEYQTSTAAHAKKSASSAKVATKEIATSLTGVKKDLAASKGEVSLASLQEATKTLVALVETLVSLVQKFLKGNSTEGSEAGSTASSSSTTSTVPSSGASSGNATSSASIPKATSATTPSSTTESVTSTSTAGSGTQDTASTSSSQTASVTSSEAAPSSPKRLEAMTDDTGAISVMTPDGYTLKAEGKDQAWQIISPEGVATRIWGDPHVSESDGDTWDFKERSTFHFGDNKVTVETVPAGNGETFSHALTIYNGEERATITGIDTNTPRLSALGSDGKQHDASLDDGVMFERRSNTRGEAWLLVEGRTKDVQGH